MNENENKNGTKPEGVHSNQAEPSESLDAEPTEPGGVDPLLVELEKTKADASRFRDQWMRAAADFDNYRKRARRDVEEAQRKGLEQALIEVLPVADNLERAVQAAAQAEDVQSIVDGVRMVLKFFEDALSRLGADRIESVGRSFDPSLHEAVQQVETAEAPAGTIMVELAPGYKLGPKLLRAAMVSVARPPSPKSETTEGPEVVSAPTPDDTSDASN